MKTLGELHFFDAIPITLGSTSPLFKCYVLQVALVLEAQHLELLAHATPENMANVPRLQDGAEHLGIMSL